MKAISPPDFAKVAITISLVVSIGIIATNGSSARAQTAISDFNGDGFADLAIGVPGEDVWSASGAGAANVLYGSAEKITSTGSQLRSQESPGIFGSAENADSFGTSEAS